MGYQFKDVCYSTESMAQDAYVQNMQPSFIKTIQQAFFITQRRLAVLGAWALTIFLTVHLSNVLLSISPLLLLALTIVTLLQIFKQV